MTSEQKSPESYVIFMDSETDPRYGIQIHHIRSGNDGDVCNAFVSYELLHGTESKYCIDIGVDEGWWSFFVTDINPALQVDSFEPNPLSYSSLQRYLHNRITLHNIAISDKTGSLPFTLNGGESNSRSTGEFEVSCQSLEPYIQNKSVDLIKIVTEGHDLIILKTLYPYLKQIKAILFECTPYWYGVTKDECIQTTVSVVSYLKTHYAHMYVLSRRGKPILTELQTMEEIQDFIEFSYTTNYQVDIVVCQNPIQSIPVYTYKNPNRS